MEFLSVICCSSRMAKTTKSKDISAGYNQFKEYNGKKYTGMKVGRTHHWYYDKADWKEKKVTPDSWEFTYSTIKRRTGHAPEGSGVPVGTGYHWFILAHQFVEKEDANNYMTQMSGLKFKLAHKRADKRSWNASEQARKKALIQYLKDVIEALEKEPEQVTPVPLHFEYKKKTYDGTAMPMLSMCGDGKCHELDITLNKKHVGVLRHKDDRWKITEIKSQGLANAIGAEIERYYERKAS